MIITAGIDVGSGAVKAVTMRHSEDHQEILSSVSSRIRKREIRSVVEEVFAKAVAEGDAEEIHYVASTGEGEDLPFATGHFYGMTTHARGALYLEPHARAVLDIGALHARAVAMDGKGRVQGYKMTSQCASGSGQFLENIARYLGVSQAEVGPLSMQSEKPEKVSSICAVLAETDVINMVSRGISTPDILRGIHESMAGRFIRLLRSLEIGRVVFVSGGLASDEGLLSAIRAGLEQEGGGDSDPIEIVSHPMSIHAGAIGAALWGGFRYRKLGRGGVAWTVSTTT